MKICLSISIWATLVLTGCASRAPDYTIFKHLVEAKKQPQEAPDLSFTPEYVRKRPPRQELGVSWVGFLEKIYPKRDRDGRVVLKLKHHFIALDTPAFKRDVKNIRFEMSEVSGGEFECRVDFKKSPALDEWAIYVDRQKAIGCTGPLIGFNRKGAPIVRGELLEGFTIQRISRFSPEIDKNTGRIALDQFGRPKYSSLDEKPIEFKTK